MTRPLSQRLCEHEDGRHAITDPRLHTFAERSDILSLGCFQDVLAWHEDRLTGDLAGDAFLDTVRRTGQIQLTASRKDGGNSSELCRPLALQGARSLHLLAVLWLC